MRGLVVAAPALLSLLVWDRAHAQPLSSLPWLGSQRTPILETVAKLEELLVDHPEEVQLRFALARAQAVAFWRDEPHRARALRRLQRALRLYRAGLADAPNDARARYEYAWCLEQANDVAAARAEYERVLEVALDEDLAREDPTWGRPLAFSAGEHLLRLLDPERDAARRDEIERRLRALADLRDSATTTTTQSSPATAPEPAATAPSEILPELERWLEHGTSTRWLMVVFAAPGAELAQWRDLRATYGRAGLRAVLVSESGGSTLAGFDGSARDPDGRIARAFGVDRRPAALLWSWQGCLLAGAPSDVTEIEAELLRAGLAAPVFEVEAAGGSEQLLRALRGSLRGTVLADVPPEIEQRAAARSSSLGPSRTSACREAHSLGARVLIRAVLDQRARRLRLDAAGASEPCPVASIELPFTALEPAIEQAAERLVASLRTFPAERPGRREIGAIGARDRARSLERRGCASEARRWYALAADAYRAQIDHEADPARVARASLDCAEILFRSERFFESAELFERALDGLPPAARDHAARSAAAAYLWALHSGELTPREHEILQRAERALTRVGRDDEPLQLARGLYSLGERWRKRASFEDARRVLRLAIEAAPASAVASWAAGDLVKSYFDEKVSRLGASAVQDGWTSPESEAERALAIGRIDRAIPLLEAAASEAVPWRSADLWAQAAAAAELHLEFRRASESYLRAWRIAERVESAFGPRASPSLLLLAAASLERAFLFEEAAGVYHLIVERVPDFREAWCRLASIHERRGAHERAGEAYERCSEPGGDRAIALKAAGAYARAGAHGRAIEVLEGMLGARARERLSPADRVTALHRIAASRRALGQLPPALAADRRCLAEASRLRPEEKALAAACALDLVEAAYVDLTTAAASTTCIKAGALRRERARLDRSVDSVVALGDPQSTLIARARRVEADLLASDQCPDAAFHEMPEAHTTRALRAAIEVVLRAETSSPSPQLDRAIDLLRATGAGGGAEPIDRRPKPALERSVDIRPRFEPR